MDEQPILERGSIFRVESANSLDDTVTFTLGPQGVSVEIDCPWAGDSEQGFGRTLGFPLTPETTARLVAFLATWLDEVVEPKGE